jgi:uncharacterized damage-inducible protein DinB
MGERWVDRTWEFTLPVQRFPSVVERVRGTPARIEDRVRGLSAEILTRRVEGAWSIQEHIGHLLDLDELHIGRLDDYLRGADALRAADMTNTKTWGAGHNTRPLPELLLAVRDKRGRFVARLDAWAPAAWGQVALHPRLKQPMRVIDMAWFVAEHDDHHLARVTELMRVLAAR